MTIGSDDFEDEDSEGEQEQEATSGKVYLDWRPVEGSTDNAQRVANVERVEVRHAPSDEYDEGELVLHQEDGVAVFDRNEMRGFRAQQGVRVPEYQEQRQAEDSSDEGAE